MNVKVVLFFEHQSHIHRPCAGRLAGRSTAGGGGETLPGLSRPAG
jgi:hypothetical protein